MSGILTASTGIWSGGDVINIQVPFVVANGVGSGTLVAGYMLTNGGEERYETEQEANPDYAELFGNWVTPTSSASNYECRMTQNSGDTLTNSSGLGTWLALSSTRSWEYLVTDVQGSRSGNFTIEIRPAGGGAVLDSSTFSISANWL